MFLGHKKYEFSMPGHGRLMLSINNATNDTVSMIGVYTVRIPFVSVNFPTGNTWTTS